MVRTRPWRLTLRSTLLAMTELISQEAIWTNSLAHLNVLKQVSLQLVEGVDGRTCKGLPNRNMLLYQCFTNDLDLVMHYAKMKDSGWQDRQNGE